MFVVVFAVRVGRKAGTCSRNCCIRLFQADACGFIAARCIV